MNPTVFTHARVVLGNEVLPEASVTVAEGRIVEVQPGRSQVPGAIDLHGGHIGRMQAGAVR